LHWRSQWHTALGEIELQSESGHWTRYEYCDVWRVREGKLAKLRAYVVAG
jgi:ketosteroid isomerase-like protein